MTTDTYPKLHSERILKNKDFFINGIAKGSGMIAPNMATMLAFIFTNYQFERKYLRKKFIEIVDKTFNSITVDGDTSTSDMILLFSIKKKQNINLKEKSQEKFLLGLEKIMSKLAEYIIKDGEGASKLITIKIRRAKTRLDAKKIGHSIANSPLFKTAMAGSDANWGRIIMAVGKSDASINPNKISLKVGKFTILKEGKIYVSSHSRSVDEYLKQRQIEITVDIGLGHFDWRILTCDFTKDYITINTDYRS